MIAELDRRIQSLAQHPRQPTNGEGFVTPPDRFIEALETERNGIASARENLIQSSLIARSKNMTLRAQHIVQTFN